MKDKFAIYYLPFLDQSVTKDNVEQYIKDNKSSVKKIYLMITVIFNSEQNINQVLDSTNDN